MKREVNLRLACRRAGWVVDFDSQCAHGVVTEGYQTKNPDKGRGLFILFQSTNALGPPLPALSWGQ